MPIFDYDLDKAKLLKVELVGDEILTETDFTTNFEALVYTIEKILVVLPNHLYTDIKLANILYDKKSRLMYLGDIDSVCTSHNSYISTYPPPEYTTGLIEKNDLVKNLEYNKAWCFFILSYLLFILFLFLSDKYIIFRNLVNEQDNIPFNYFINISGTESNKYFHKLDSSIQKTKLIDLLNFLKSSKIPELFRAIFNRFNISDKDKYYLSYTTP